MTQAPCFEPLQEFFRAVYRELLPERVWRSEEENQVKKNHKLLLTCCPNESDLPVLFVYRNTLTKKDLYLTLNGEPYRYWQDSHQFTPLTLKDALLRAAPHA